MKAIITDKDALEALQPQQIEAYLRNKGYACTESGTVATYWGISDFELGLPRDAGYVDYPYRVSDLLTLLAKAEGRSQLDIFADIAKEG